MSGKTNIMMTNYTVSVFVSVFTIDGFDLAPKASYVTAAIVILIYLFALCTNLLLLGIIAAHTHLHQSMYILLACLSLNDIVGMTAMVPPVIYNLMSEYRHTSFLACLFQALFLHLYGSGACIILSVMAFDRYIAICYPLRYHVIMSKTKVKYTMLLFCFINFLLVGSVFALTLRFPFCSTHVSNYFCDNMSILKMTCAKDTSINNIYGLFLTGFCHGLCLLSVVFSYAFILIICFISKHSDARSKALYTCATHLLVYVIFECSVATVVLVHRFPNSSPNLKKFMGMSGVLIPSCFNPVIYGVKTKDIRQKVKLIHFNRIFHRHAFPEPKQKTENYN